MSIKKVDIRPGVSVLAVLRHLNYTPWFALAEFVDNALQSFMQHRPELEISEGRVFKLRVNIDIDSSLPPEFRFETMPPESSLRNFPAHFAPPPFHPIARALPSSAWA